MKLVVRQIGSSYIPHEAIFEMRNLRSASAIGQVQSIECAVIKRIVAGLRSAGVPGS
jgi:hypothetical protein